MMSISLLVLQIINKSLINPQWKSRLTFLISLTGPPFPKKNTKVKSGFKSQGSYNGGYTDQKS